MRWLNGDLVYKIYQNGNYGDKFFNHPLFWDLADCQISTTVYDGQWWWLSRMLADDETSMLLCLGC